MKLSTKTETFWVYRLKCGKYYKRHTKGSWAVSMHGVSKKDITSGIEGAERFEEPLDSPPLFHQSTVGGEWVEIKVTTVIEKVEQ